LAVSFGQSQNHTAAGVPFLSRIPLLGYLFKNTTKDKSRTELVVLIRPVVTTGPAEAVNVRERGQEFLNMESDIESGLVPPGMRKRIPPERLLRAPKVEVRETELTISPK
jgi:type II secretory pathway component GspD/PulD (secretin)